MVGAGSIVPGTFRGIVADKHTSGRIDPVHYGPWILHRDDEVFRGIFIGEIDNVRSVVEHDDPAVGQGLGYYIRSRERAALAFDCLFDRIRHRCRTADQDRLAVRAVLRLGKEIRGHELGRSGGIGEDHHLGRTCRHVDGCCGESKHLLGLHDETVAGAEDLVTPSDGGRSVAHRGDCLGTAGLVDFCDPAQERRPDNHRIGLSVRSRRGAKHDFRTAGNFRGDRKHQHGGEERCPSSGNIQADTSQRNGLLNASDAWGRVQIDRPRQLCLMEFSDVLHGKTDRGLESLRHRVFSLDLFLFSDFQVSCLGEGSMVEAVLIFNDCGVAVPADRV